LAFWGCGHKAICDGAGEGLKVVEPGIGYPYGHFAEYKIFESYAMYHSFMKTDRVGHCVGMDLWSKEAVIPNYFVVDDFVDQVIPMKDRDDYFLFVGRVGVAKGLEHAVRMTERLGVRLVVAGQNSEEGFREANVFPPPAHVEIVGHVDTEKRKMLMAKAKAVVCMSMFAEPFCGVHVEAMMSGTPVITGDWGAFAECNVHGVTGFRCRTLDQMVEAGRRIHEIDPMACRTWAMNNFSTERVAAMYEAFFEGRMMPTSTKKVAVWSEMKWALGRISKAIKKYLPYQVDMYDWENGTDNGALWCTNKWREYDAIISNTSLHRIKELYGIEPCQEMLKRFVVIAHCPRFEGMTLFKETLDRYSPLSKYCGVSQETCLEMKKYGIDASYTPFGVDTDAFPVSHVVRPVRHLGIIGNKGNVEEYNRIKGYEMFEDICTRGGYEPVHIFGRDGKDMYSDIDALICCSQLEGGPLGVFEAASCGVPVLTRPVGNAREIKGVAMFETADEALEILETWKDLEKLRTYAEAVTNEVRTNWGMQNLITRYLAPII
jgi:glycosyltransferase involved in cell wall biosynthesis